MDADMRRVFSFQSRRLTHRRGQEDQEAMMVLKEGPRKRSHTFALIPPALMRSWQIILDSL